MKQTIATISGLDIQKEYLTVAQYSADEHAVMLVAIQPLSGGDHSCSSPAVSAEIGALKGKFKFGTAPINCTLSGEFAVIKKIPVEPQEKDINSALQWEFEQQIVGSVEEYAFDYQHIGTGPDGISEYLLVAYRKEPVDSFSALMKKHKLTGGVVDLDYFSLVNVFEANYPEATDRPVLLLHAESTRANLIMTHHGNYVDHTVFAFDDGAEPAIIAGLLQTASQQLCSITTLTGGAADVPVFATGGLFTRNGLLEDLQATTGNITLLDPFKKIGCRIGVDKEKLAVFLPQLSVAVGCALRGGDDL